MAKVPFSDDIIFLVLDKLKQGDFVQSLIHDLKNLFKVLEYNVVARIPCMQVNIQAMGCSLCEQIFYKLTKIWYSI